MFKSLAIRKTNQNHNDVSLHITQVSTVQKKKKKTGLECQRKPRSWNFAHTAVGKWTGTANLPQHAFSSSSVN